MLANPAIAMMLLEIVFMIVYLDKLSGSGNSPLVFYVFGHAVIAILIVLDGPHEVQHMVVMTIFQLAIMVLAVISMSFRRGASIILSTNEKEMRYNYAKYNVATLVVLDISIIYRFFSSYNKSQEMNELGYYACYVFALLVIISASNNYSATNTLVVILSVFAIMMLCILIMAFMYFAQNYEIVLNKYDIVVEYSKTSFPN